jgi:hypothetical protein
VLHTVEVLAFVLRAIIEFLFSKSMLFIAAPLANIFDSVSESISAKTLGVIVHPLPLIDVSVGVDEHSPAMAHIVFEITLVFASI